MVNLVACKRLRVPIVANLVDEPGNQLALGLDDFDDVVHLADALLEVRRSNCDDADVSVVGAAVHLDVVVLALKTVEEGEDGIVRRVWEELAARGDLRFGQRGSPVT